MLGSLIKYEFKATYKTVLVLYTLVLIFAGINRFFSDITTGMGIISEYTQSDIAEVMFFGFTLIYLIILVALAVLTIFITIKRFYTNIFGDAGYLMNTIPVPPWMNIVSKLIPAFVWVICGIFVAGLSILILIMREFFYITDIFKYLIMEIDHETFVFLLKFGICVVLQQVSNIMIIYCSIAIGSLFNKHKKIAAFVAFLISMFIISITANFILKFFGFNEFSYFSQVTSFIHSGIVVNILFIVLPFIITNYILKNRLNLE